MLATLARSTSLALTGIIAGIYVRDLIATPATKRLPGPQFARYHQELDREFARVMPFIGNAALLAGLGTTALPQNGRSRVLAAAALGCGLAEIALTLTRAVPLNRQIQSWSADVPPADWAAVRDRWFAEHRIRTGLGLLGLGCQIAAALGR